MKRHIAIIGGGIAGASLALRLGKLGCRVRLFERESTLVSGPPFCHLHAGGNLYREIDDAQCRTLLRQSLDFAAMYPFGIDHRPTLIAVPIRDQGSPDALLARLEMLRDTYRAEVARDTSRALLGDPKEYFKLVDRAMFQELLGQRPPATIPANDTQWLVAAAHLIDPTRIQFPLILVREYGINLFMIAAGITRALEMMEHVAICTDTSITSVTKRRDGRWELVSTSGDEGVYDYLVNAAGFRTGHIDDMLGITCKRMVEFKAAYVARWQHPNIPYFPEMIFHGTRGTLEGMGQLTPYPGGYIQLHAMRPDATLYPDGIVAAPRGTCQAPLPQAHLRKIEHGWSLDEIHVRTKQALAHLGYFIPEIIHAHSGIKPLYGAQQIPGDNPHLRVAQATFPLSRYARCEIVKVSSVGDMCDAILKDMATYGLLNNVTHMHSILDNINSKDLLALARHIAAQRGYPEAMASCVAPADI